ncbi:MAG: dipeptide ABC transporter ATP-binding protein [Elusimicrobia bacterium]|nr:dipeptide ABC transporter ATP-binding protein [Elusimicrobiota bacterium]
MNSEIILQAKNLKKYFILSKGVIRKKILGTVKAVDGVNLDIHEGETLGIVGETGCGKSTLGRLIMGLETPTEGAVLFKGRDLWSSDKAQWKNFRSQVQIVFQDPFSSLNPRMKIKDVIAEPLIIHQTARGGEMQERVNELLNLVGLASHHAERYPHEFSGGQRQRIGIARALALNPKVIVCDEPVSALDVSIQAQVLNLLDHLQKKLRLTYLFISHDLSVVKHIATRVAVMYLGRIVELAPSREVFTNPQHPYTEALLSSCPIPDPGLRERPRILLTGDVPSPLNPPTGCYFHPRCRFVQESCRKDEPAWVETASGHGALCPIAPFSNQPSPAAIHFKDKIETVIVN